MFNIRKNIFKYFRFFIVFAIISLFYAQIASAQRMQEEAKNMIIAGISVEGNSFVSSETIISLSGLRVGDVLSSVNETKIQSAIINLWKRKQFHKVDIIVDKISDAGIFILIKVEEFPRLNQIIIEGNDELSEKDIKEAANKNKGEVLSNYDTSLINREILKKYSEEGLLFAKIEPVIRYTELKNYVDLHLFIDEGNKFKVNSIIVEGNDKIDDDDLVDSFEETKTKHWWEIWKSVKFDKAKYEDDKKLLTEYYRNQGFLDAEILKDTVIYSPDNGKVDIVLTVNEGNQYFIRNINFEGNSVYSDDILKRRLDVLQGDIYDAGKIASNLEANQDQTDAASLYMDNGYLQARLIPQEKRISKDSIDLTVMVYEGIRFRNGKIIIVGNTKTKDKVIRRELYTRPGEYFDRSAIIRSIRALGMMNYFNAEKLKPDVTASEIDNTSVDITYNVEEHSTDTFNASIGFAGTFGLTGSIGFSFNNFSLLEPFSGGGGQIFSFNWEFGSFSRYQTFSIGFTEPWLNDEPTTIGFNLFDTRYSYYFDMRRTGATVNIGRRFKWPDDYWRGDWSLRWMYNDVGEGSSSYFIPGTEITLSQRFSRISTNNQFFPSVGSKFGFNNDFAMGSLGIGTTDYLKTEINYDAFTPLLSFDGIDRLVFMVSSKWGYVSGFKSDSTIPPIERYYLGGNGLSGWGVTPLRGYEDRSIGNDNGDFVLSRYTAELRFAISLEPMPIYVYAFAEAGNVWSSFAKTDPFDLKRSAGAGVHLFINPIGMLGFSYGYGFDNPKGSTSPSGWKFLFHLGNQ
ncbi:MAG: outer membrane protein assembly factor BamA [Ignavibacteria bacterium GWF2_33_9]|nr:MAG: outer membrane protein assembly factor BamA [Ignavibacteria bacterium GWF2_33_9]